MGGGVCPCCGHELKAPPDPVALGTALKLTPIQRRLYERLSASFGRFVSTRQMIDAAYSEEIDGGPEWARVTISRALRELGIRVRPYGLTIDGGGHGVRSGKRLTWSTDES